MKTSFKAFLYVFLLTGFITNALPTFIDHQWLYLYLALIYFDCKDHNIRSLILVVAFVEFIFFELDYAAYVISKYYIQTGPIAGDIILNCIILINMSVLMLSVNFRQELSDFFCQTFNINKIQYRPTKADYLIISSARICFYIYALIFLLNGWVINTYLEATDPLIKSAIKQKLVDDGNLIIDIEATINSLRYLIILLVMLPWSKESEEKNAKQQMIKF